MLWRERGVNNMGETKNQEKLPNRWTRVIGAVLMQLALGSIYAWSIFNKPLAHYLDEPSKSLQVLGIFATSLAGFGLFVTVGGRLQDKYGPRNIGILAGVVYAIGYLASWQFYKELPLMYVAYGLLGAGVGIGYSCPLSCCVKWFPDKRGLISGIAVAGFGAGTFIFAQVGAAIIGNSPYTGLGDSYLALGLVFLVMVVAGSFLLCDPPAGYCPAGWTPPLQGAGSTAKKQFVWREMIRTKSFIMIWVMFVLSATCGLMMVGNISNVAASFKGFTHPATSAASDIIATKASNVALLAGIYAIFNGTGRIAWGFVSDKLGRTQAMRTMFLFQAIGLFASAAFVLSKPSDQTIQFAGLAVFDSWIGFCFGGNFAMFPPLTSEYFGTKFFGFNYGLVFTSYAVGGVVGGLMPGIIKGGFEWVFILTGVGSLVAFLIALMTKPPVVKDEEKATPA
jgi:OFA family oxalate/formate antiporter-like MFS transporter